MTNTSHLEENRFGLIKNIITCPIFSYLIMRGVRLRIYKLEGILMLEGDLKSASNFKDLL